MRRGFTMIEMLGASVLGAILMTTTLTVISSIARSNLAMARSAAANPWPTDLVEVLRTDLLNCRILSHEGERIRLVGFSSVERQTLRPTHRLAEVQYGIENIGGRKWLVRRQREATGDSQDLLWLVCPDVQSVKLERDAPATRRAHGADEVEIPKRLRLTVRSTRPGVQPISRLVVLQ